MSDVLLALGRRDEALATQRQALATFETLSAVDPANVTGRNDIAISESKIGEILDGSGRWLEAVWSYERALSIHQALAASIRKRCHDARGRQRQNRIATTQARLGAREASLSNHTRAVTATRALRDANAGNVELTVALALGLGGRADALLMFARKVPALPTRAEDPAAAERDYTESVALLTALERSAPSRGRTSRRSRITGRSSPASGRNCPRPSPALNLLHEALRTSRWVMAIAAPQVRPPTNPSA